MILLYILIFIEFLLGHVIQCLIRVTLSKKCTFKFHYNGITMTYNIKLIIVKFLQSKHSYN